VATAEHMDTALLATASSAFLAARNAAHGALAVSAGAPRSGWGAAARRAALRK
jgi:hypothetical protein